MICLTRMCLPVHAGGRSFCERWPGSFLTRSTICRWTAEVPVTGMGREGSQLLSCSQNLWCLSASRVLLMATRFCCNIRQPLQAHAVLLSVWEPAKGCHLKLSTVTAS